MILRFILIITSFSFLAGCFLQSEKPQQMTSLVLVPVVMERQVIDLQDGSAEPLKDGDIIQVKFKIWAYDPSKTEGKGRLIEESPQETPLSIKLGAKSVLPAWEESMVGMKVGGRRLILLPPDQAYGRQKISDSIKPSTPLIIEVEVLKKKVSMEP